MELKLGNGQKYKKKYTPHVYNIKERVDLIEEYVAQYGSEIPVRTVYKGVCIGHYLASVRRAISRGKNNYDKESFERLKNLGVLDYRMEKIADRVSRIEEYIAQNPILWTKSSSILNRFTKLTKNKNLDEMPESEKNEIERALEEFFKETYPEIFDHEIDLSKGEYQAIDKINELKKAIKDFDYIRVRKGKGKLAPELEEKLKTVGTGKVIGYTEGIDEISKNAGISITFLKDIQKNFGSIQNFRDIYIKMLLNYIYWSQTPTERANKLALPEEYPYEIFDSITSFSDFIETYNALAKENKIVRAFDLDQDSLVANKAVEDIVDKAEGVYVSGGILSSNRIVEELAFYLTPRQIDFIKANIRTGGHLNNVALGRELNTTSEAVRQVSDKAYKRIASQDNRVISTKSIFIIHQEDKDRVIDLDLNKVTQSGKVLYLGIPEEKRKEFIKTYFAEKDIFVTEDTYNMPLELREKLLDTISSRIEKHRVNGEISSSNAEDEDIDLMDARLLESFNNLYNAYNELEAKIKIARNKRDKVQAKIIEGRNNNYKGYHVRELNKDLKMYNELIKRYDKEEKQILLAIEELKGEWR